MCLLPIATRPFKVQQQCNDYCAIDDHKAASGGRMPQAWLFSSCWGPGTVSSWDVQPLCITFIVPHYVSASFCFSATARGLQEGAVEAALGAHCRPWVLSVNWGSYKSASEEILKLTLKVCDVLLNCGLAPIGKRPLVVIDECQVLYNIVFSHGEEGLESGGESLSGQVKAHSLFCVIHPWGLNDESVTGASLAFIFHKSQLKHANVGKCCIEQIRRLKMSMIEIRNIASKQIQLKKSNKSYCTASLQKGYEIGGRGSEGSSEKFCEEFFSPVGLILLSTHRGFQIYPILAA